MLKEKDNNTMRLNWNCMPVVPGCFQLSAIVWYGDGDGDGDRLF
jgi:hypothetical protein